MIPLLLAFRGLARAIVAVWRDPETKALPVVAGALVLTGTLFYWRFEDWTFIESLYFCVVTLTTVGYGDFSPTTAGTQIFTIVYILTGFGVLVALLTSVAQQYLKHKTEPRPREHVGAPVDTATHRLRRRAAVEPDPAVPVKPI
jgi:voltage-gated potassium channel